MTARLHEATLDHALQIARDVDLEGPGQLLSPDVVTWLAQLALGHPQVSAAVAAALPSSGVRWAGVWTEGAEASRREVSGVICGRIVGSWSRGWQWFLAAGHTNGRAGNPDAARAEVDERLIAAGYTLLGAVYRRAGVSP